MPATATQKGPGGRPTMAEAERRCKQTNTRWTIAEHGHLHRQAAAAGLSVGEFIRRRALLLPVTPPPQRCDARMLHELNAIGVNFNQLLPTLHRLAHYMDDYPKFVQLMEQINPEEWSTIQSELRRVLEKVGAVIQ